MRAVCTAACLVAALTGASLAPAQGLPVKKTLTLEIAQNLAEGALASCRGSGYKVSVLIVDDGDHALLFLHDDGATNATSELAQLKAASVILLGRASGPPANLPAGAPVPPPVVPGTVNIQGGVPIMVDNQLIGAVAVSGAPGGDKDAACARAGLAKVADQLH